MADLARPTRAGLVVQAVETLRIVAGPPAEDRRTRHRDPGGDLGVGQPVRGQQQDPGPNDDESGRKALTVVGTVILRDVHPMCTDVSASGSADAATP